MIFQITSALQKAFVDKKCKFILFYGTGGKGFCSGGDVKELIQEVIRKDYNAVNSFFENEYVLDLTIHNSPKPVIVIADGITMGGGLGICAGADIVIATERTRMAMPEARIGFFPDVGATGWLFRKCPQGYPEYLSLTGYEMQGMECVRVGLATQFINSRQIPELIKKIAEFQPNDTSDKKLLLAEVINRLLPYFDRRIAANKDMDDWVAKYFSGKENLTALLNSLASCAGEKKLCANVFSNIAERSPTALVLTLKLLRHNEKHPLHEVFNTELRAARYMTQHHDYREGVRARILDKDNVPRWNPDQIEKVDLSDLIL
jgi:enoyl-CoA hydratase/carnithine racemase